MNDRSDVPTAAVRTVKLRKVYGNNVAVDDLDLTVNGGEIFGLLGPNGAGKTTTGGMITTRVLPTSGQAFVGDVDVVAHPAEAKAKIGVVPQSNTLDRALSVAQNLYFHGRYFGMSKRVAKEKTDELLTRFRLEDRAKLSVSALSGGMAQRLMVARAIMHEPTVLVLDEPTSGLDPQSRLALWDILRDLNGAGQTVLLTTHYMEEADELCDRIAIMDHGKILALGSASELKAKAGGASTLLVKVSGDPGELIQKLENAIGVDERVKIVMSESGVKIIGKDVAQLISKVVSSAEGLGLKVYDLSLVQPSLETVFINLTGRELRD
ncbi:ABC-2 type transport system ATP-binding protein [Ferrithrix thermotolerans DSM 19514]|uniref:ABC-2 type transport system ATP-binding protein n=1 Tax=Ferrithrix thermotolerans DSM 19514 TaxID=1121881 RepID=A0A1M4WJY4_9ACTN|nr:ATP-binding cassette domain-containing protein [Ferrithrix thermotolerans]SHE81393.1 ABC-2 type transport system ATP-binding protein [Ferrithrix thermotolerans DSM 19514]